MRTVLVPVVVVVAGLAAGAPSDADETGADLARAVEDLGHPDYEVRERAFRTLWAAGARAGRALRAAADGPDPEVSARARQLLDHLEFAIEPETPAEVVDLVETYRDGDMETKGVAVDRLLAVGRPAYEPLVRLARHEAEPELRAAIFRLLSQRAKDAPAVLLAEGEVEAAEELLELGVSLGDARARKDYAAFLAVSGRLDEPADGSVLRAHLLRAAGRGREALEAAPDDAADWLLEALFLEHGDWARLASRARARKPRGIEDLGYQAAYARRAGDAEGAGEALDAILALGRREADEAWFVAEALFLNDRPVEAIECLRRGDRAAVVYDLLAARVDLEAAAEWAETAGRGSGRDALRVRIHHARTLCGLGEVDAARRRLLEIGERVDVPADLGSFVALLEAELEIGRRDLALARAAVGLERCPTDGERQWILGRLFEEKGEVALRWWDHLRRRHPDLPAAARLARLVGILGPARDAEVFAEEVEAAEAALAGKGGGALAGWLVALAETYAAAGCEADELRCLERAAELEGRAHPWIRLGERLARAGRWERAAEAYGRAALQGTSPAALWLEGYARTRSGAAGGEEAMLRARLAALGDESHRFSLAEAMRRHGLETEAAAERRLLLRTGSPTSWEYGEALRIEAEARAAEGDWGAAADALERSMLRCLSTSTAYLEPEAYLLVPHRVHGWRARAALDAGEVDAAVALSERARAFLPWDPELTGVVVAALERAGRSEEAGELFDRAFERYETLCARYPRAARLHHDLARLALAADRCRDAALAHAAKAAELDPGRTEYARTARRAGRSR